MQFRRLALCIGITLVMGSVGAREAMAQASTKRIGGVTGTSIDECLLNAQLGATIVRTGLDWYLLQPTPAPIDWSYQDNVFQCFVSHGMKIYYTLAYAPDWAGGHWNGEVTQSHVPDINAWKQFVRDVIYHYSYVFPLGDNITYGIWNEPEGGFLNGCPVSNKGDCWGQFLWLPAAQARDEINPSARLAGPEMGTNDNRLDAALSWMAQSIRPQDVITAHWYPGFFPNMGDWIAGVAFKAGNRETWLTETGINDCNNSSQASALDNYLNWFVKASPYSYYWTTFIYYQVTVGPGQGCMGIRNKPAFGVMQYWLDVIEQANQQPVLAGLFSFQASNGQYMVAESNGNNIVNANRDVASTWESFWVWDLNGGSLQSGDPINILTQDGWYFSAVNEGGSTLNTYVQQALTWERFYVDRVAGPGTVNHGDPIAIRTANGHYLVAEGGGGDIVNANRTGVGPWETFTVIRH